MARKEGKRILDALNEARRWVEGRNGERLKIHLPDGTIREMTIQEYRAMRVRGDGPVVPESQH